VQAVNFLDLVSDDGHSLDIYFYYVSLNLPKIFSKTVTFVFFISIFYVVNKYNNSNELIVFWNNGIKKIQFINFILRFSIIFLFLQLALNLFVVPKSQNLARVFIKESNIDFLPKLISEKKFINVVKNLTIFVEEYEKNGDLKKIYINEKIDSEKSKIIVSESGKILKQSNKYILRLYNGGITNINKDSTYKINFSETDYDLSNFSTKTVTYPKMQELDSIFLFKCIRNYFVNEKTNKIQITKISSDKYCETRSLTSISEEIYKRLIMPFYTMIISLIAASLIIEPKSRYFMKFHKLNIFLIGTFILILSQLGLKFFLISVSMTILIILLPIILISIYYLLLFIITKFKFNYL
tara:strand:- start:648 stop:1706 length:1059 start_codon:yes stop_codon:yes gene_type:complete